MIQRFVSGRLEIRPDERRVLIDGTPASPGARAFDLLLALIEHRHRVASKAELIERVWPDLVVEENNLAVQVAALRKLLGTDAIATVAGRGYRLTLPLAEAPAEPSAPAESVAPASEPALPDRPSIAVLPFDNLSPEPDQDLFVDGLVEDIVTELSRFRQLFVIARSSSFSYRGRPTDPRTIARELGVRYLLGGSVRRHHERIRVSAQLVDAASGSQVWAERYDRHLNDVFRVQEELTHAIVTELWPQLEDSELRRTRLSSAASVGSYELALRARWLMRQAFLHGGQPAHEREAESLLLQARTLDPDNGELWRAAAYLRWLQLWSGTADSPEAALAEGLAATQRAIEINPGDYMAHHRRAMLKAMSDQDDNGLQDILQAHALNPNDTGTLSMLATYEAGHGQVEQGMVHAADTLRLSPRDPLRLHFYNMHQFIHFYAGRYAQSLDWCDRALGESAQHAPSQFSRMLALAALGDVKAAREQCAALRNAAPVFALARLAGRIPRYCSPAIFDHLRHCMALAAA